MIQVTGLSSNVKTERSCAEIISSGFEFKGNIWFYTLELGYMALLGMLGSVRRTIFNSSLI